MLSDPSLLWSFVQTLSFSILGLALTTFALAWSRKKVLLWQQNTNKKYVLSRAGSKRLLSTLKSDLSAQTNNHKIKHKKKKSKAKNNESVDKVLKNNRFSNSTPTKQLPSIITKA